MGVMPTAPVRLGRYELLARIGEGGMAEVHLARLHGARQFEKLVVVKTVHPRLAEVPSLIEGLLDEARIAALVKHPNVVDIYDLGEEDGTCFIAMEYLAGESLFSVLRQTQRGPRLDRWSVAQIVADGAAGLGAAHELRDLAGERLELVHQDVSPGNVFILYSGQVKLVDFGVAKVRSTAEDGQVRGKTGYLAPELFDGAPADRRTDVFSLGVVMWEGLTQRRLYTGANERERMAKARAARIAPPSSVMPDVGKSLDDICLRAVARDPAQRYPTAAAMHEDLIAALRSAGRVGDHDTIGRFMRERFAAEIAAREELLRRLVGSDALAAGTRRPTMPPTRSSQPSQPPPLAIATGPRTAQVAVGDAPTGLGESRIATAFAADLAAAIEGAPGSGLVAPAERSGERESGPAVPPPLPPGRGTAPPPFEPGGRGPAAIAMLKPEVAATPAEPTPTPMLTPVPLSREADDGARGSGAVAAANSTPVPASAVSAPASAMSAPASVAAPAVTSAVPAAPAPQGAAPSSAALQPIPMVRLAAMTAPPPVATSSTVDGPPPPASVGSRGEVATIGDGAGSRPTAALAPWSPAPFDGEFDDELDGEPDDDEPAMAPVISQPATPVRPPPIAPAAVMPSPQPSPPAAVRTAPGSRPRWLMPALGVGAVAVVGAIVLAASGGGSSSSRRQAADLPPSASAGAAAKASEAGAIARGDREPSKALSPAPSPGEVAPSVAPPAGEVAPPAGEVAPPAGQVAPPAGEVAPAPTAPVPTDPAPTPRVRTGPSATQLYTEGQQSFVIGNYTTALRLYQTAAARDPRMAVAYRGMGLVYDRLGDRARASKAFRTYLKLSPRARDAGLIKQRLEKLP